MVIWGNASAGDCVHGEPATTCRACHPSHQELIDSPWALVFGVLLVLAALVLGPSTIRRELANDDAQARRHREFVERFAPKTFVQVTPAQ